MLELLIGSAKKGAPTFAISGMYFTAVSEMSFKVGLVTPVLTIVDDSGRNSAGMFTPVLTIIADEGRESAGVFVPVLTVIDVG